MIVMHPKYIDEIKNHPDLSFTDAIKRVSQEISSSSGQTLIDLIELLRRPDIWL